MSKMLVPVTDDLRDAMADSWELISEDRSSRSWNDKRYPDAARQLSYLTTAIVEAMSTLKPLNPSGRIGARFDCAFDSPLMRKLTIYTAYLNDQAAPLIKAGGFGEWSKKELNDVVSLLEDMYHTLTGSISKQATEDIIQIRDKGPEALIVAANWIGNATQEPDEQD